MGRPLRRQYPGALYHVTSRGNRRAHIYLDERDYLIWQDLLADTVRRYNFVVHAWCQMPNHYHLVIQTVEGNLSDGMQYLNSMYSKRFNWRHDLVGHVIQGRFWDDVIDSDQRLLAAARYVAQNPVRAKLVASPDDWRWGSHIHLSGQKSPLDWFGTDWLLSQFANASAGAAMDRYRAFVDEVPLAPNPFADEAGRKLDPLVARRRAALPLDEYPRRYDDRAEGMARAYFTTVYTMRAIAEQFGVSTRTVSRAVAALEERLKAELVSMSVSDTMVDTN